MEKWLSESLSELLDFQVPDDLINYILSIQNENDLHEYMKTLLDFDNPQHKNFFKELTQQKYPKSSKQQKKKNKSSKLQNDSVQVENVPDNIPESDSKPGGKKKTKFVNLYSQEGKNAQVILIKGRHRCDCQAVKHELINNCLQCGRIVCKQEGSGPCLFCGNLVCTPQEQREINAKTKASAKLMESLMERSRPKGWEATLLQRNRLLEYDRTSERRTRVTDDDSDYFNTNSVWLSSNERDKLQKYQQSLHEKKHASRLSKKMTFDFAGRQIIEAESTDHLVDEDKIRELTGSSSGHREMSLEADWFSGDAAGRDVAPGVNAPLLQFDPSVGGLAIVSGGGSGGGGPGGVGGVTSRVQDAALQEMADSALCLSMHQPWASLLVEGIKMHEGRTWYTSHRGRLWIASTVKPPDQEVVKALENRYRVLYPDKQLQFPTFYPTGCLLGCVNVEDCLSQEEYEKRYPEGESDSPYVFICTNPVSLKLRFPVKGQHKIYKLDKTIHQAAVKCIQKMSKMQAEQANAG